MNWYGLDSYHQAGHHTSVWTGQLASHSVHLCEHSAPSNERARYWYIRLVYLPSSMLLISLFSTPLSQGLLLGDSNPINHIQSNISIHGCSSLLLMFPWQFAVIISPSNLTNPLYIRKAQIVLILSFSGDKWSFQKMLSFLKNGGKLNGMDGPEICFSGLKLVWLRRLLLEGSCTRQQRGSPLNRVWGKDRY